MEIANIVIALLALIVAVIAILVSIRQAIKSDNVALLGLRIEFYNYLCEFIRRYNMLSNFEQMKNAKNSQLVFPQGAKTPLIQIILLYLGNNNPALAFQKITNDLNYLDINKYLFSDEIITQIDKIISKLNDFKLIAEECLQKKKSETELQEVIVSLREMLDNISQSLMEDIKNVIATNKKNK